MLYIGEGFHGDGPHAAHINVLLGPQSVLATAFATAAASPTAGHVPFQVVLKPNVPVKPATLFIAKAGLKHSMHELMTWGPAQLGVAAGITQALLDGTLPEDSAQWLAIALVWVDSAATGKELVYHNNLHAMGLAVRRALDPHWPNRNTLTEALATLGNPFFTPLS